MEISHINNKLKLN